ncbi:ankyrin repeat and SOCS box protein 11-like [Limanda limanda]|uniref:ankyrin repeat and SOCS box protein 11-like n=1 Tax=Limanda limanda TaxID=27771 RepID=UPI0029C77C57|nr:ankyrin repeat and SOCS box protein 11-like [Limanda limanda]
MFEFDFQAVVTCYPLLGCVSREDELESSELKWSTKVQSLEVENRCLQDQAALLQSRQSQLEEELKRTHEQHNALSSTTHQIVSPIHEVSRRGHRECLELLLSYGSHVDVKLPVVGTPLYAACTAGAVVSVELLLRTGADVQIGCGQDSPLHAAVRFGGADVVDLLLDFGADVCCRNAEGKTPMDLSALNSPVRTKLQTRGPYALSELSRFCIPRRLGRNRLHRVSSLCIPHSIQDFLLYR